MNMKKLDWMAGLTAALVLSMAAPAAAQDQPVGKKPPAKEVPKPRGDTPHPGKPAAPAPAAKAPVAAPPAAAKAPVAAKPAAPPVAAKAPAKPAAKALQPQAGQPQAGQPQAEPAPATDSCGCTADDLLCAMRCSSGPSQNQAAPSGDMKPGEPTEPAAKDPNATPSDMTARWSDDVLTKTLASYGQWIQDERFGQVWIPDPKGVGKSFTPYVSGGHWGVDNGQWGWVSDYPWGSIPFHYGNWTWLGGEKGWAWVPGRTFAPAWVVWRLGEPGYDFVGWAPMPPAAKAPAADAPPGAVTQPSLPFWFAPTRRLFSRNLEANVVTDRALGQEVLSHSRIFEGNKAEGGSFIAASPSFKDARIRALRKVVLSTANRPFATPPAAAPAEPAPAQPEPQTQQFASPPPQQAGAPQAGQPQAGARPQYRCHLLSTHPRAWRCGYE
jgi:hypothetical protein